MRQGVLGEVPQCKLQLTLDRWDLRHTHEQFVVLEEIGELSRIDAEIHVDSLFKI
jgi:hypothetical protein